MISKRRYSPLYIVFEWFNLIKNTFVFAILIFVLRRSDSFYMTSVRWIFIAYVLWKIVWAVVSWLVERYEMNEEALIRYQGIWNKVEQTIPLERIQNVHLKRNLFHRWFRITGLTLETATAEDDDTIHFAVIPEKEAEIIQDYLKQLKVIEEKPDSGKISVSDEKEAKELNDKASDYTVHFRPTTKEIIFASFTSLNFLIVIPLLFAAYSFAEQFLAVDEFMRQWVGHLTGIMIAGIIVGLGVLSIIIGMIVTYLTYGNYELSSDQKTIYIRKGIWEESYLTISKDRVQGLQFEQTFLKRLFRLTSVKLLMIQEGESEINTLYPFLPTQRAKSIVKDLLPSYRIKEENQTLPQRSFYVRLIDTLTFFLVVTILLWVFQPKIFGTVWISLAAGPVLCLIVIVYRLIKYKQTKYILHDGFIQWYTAVFRTKRLLLHRKQTIEMKVEKSLFQRIFNVSSVTLVLRGKPVKEYLLSDLPEEDAQQLMSWYFNRKKEVVFIDDTFQKPIQH